MRPPIWRGKVHEGRIVLDIPDRFKKYLSTLEGKRVELILRAKLPWTSDRQRRYYWGVVLHDLGEHLGYSKEELDEILKKKFNIESVSRLTTEAMEKYLSDIKSFAAQELDFNIQDPNSSEF